MGEQMGEQQGDKLEICQTLTREENISLRVKNLFGGDTIYTLQRRLTVTNIDASGRTVGNYKLVWVDASGEECDYEVRTLLEGILSVLINKRKNSEAQNGN